VEQIMLAWLMLGLNPLMRRFEARVLKDLIAPGERGTHYLEFNRDALMQADSAARAEFLSKMVQNGLLTRNEARALINRPAAADQNADALTAQLNLAPLDKLGETRAFIPETQP
jgi:phage portal protein BeeE